MKTKEKLQLKDRIDRRNAERLASFKAAEDPETERKRARLAKIEGCSRAKPGREKDYDDMIAHYHRELMID